VADITLWAVHGPDPETDVERMLEVFMTEAEAEKFLGALIMTGATAALLAVRRGGTMSMLITRGKGPMRMSGGYTVDNRDGHSMRAEYRVESLAVPAVVPE